MPRPSKLTPKVADKLCKVIASGNYASTAYRAAGIAERTFYDWMEKGEHDLRYSIESEYADLYGRIKEAEAKREERLCLLVSTQAVRDWRAAAWMLRVMHPKRYGDRIDLNYAGDIEVRHSVDTRKMLENLDDEELNQLRAILGKANRGGHNGRAVEATSNRVHVLDVPTISRQLAPSGDGSETGEAADRGDQETDDIPPTTPREK